MKDYKPEHGSADDKLSRAKGYLIERGIYRGISDCSHKYTTADGKRVSPELYIERNNSLNVPF